MNAFVFTIVGWFLIWFAAAVPLCSLRGAAILVGGVLLVTAHRWG